MKAPGARCMLCVNRAAGCLPALTPGYLLYILAHCCSARALYTSWHRLWGPLHQHHIWNQHSPVLVCLEGGRCGGRRPTARHRTNDHGRAGAAHTGALPILRLQ